MTGDEVLKRFGVAVRADMKAVWDEATATLACTQCGAQPGNECEPLGFRPHRVRYDGIETT